MNFATKLFTQDEQVAFADYSGDYNPIHLDPVSARRTEMGQPIVHGMNAFLWALDTVAASDIEFARITTLKVEFRKPIYVGEPLVLVVVNRSVTNLKLNLCAAEVVLATIIIEGASNSNPEAGHAKTSGRDNGLRVAVQGIDQIPHHRSGILPLRESDAPQVGLETRYCGAVHWLGLARFRAVAALSRLVGMECPGLHSLFVSAEILFAEANGPDHLAYAVKEVDERFQIVRIAIKSSGLAGIVAARLRATPVAQPSLADIAPYVSPGEFSGLTPLIIGGSRGLGELTAKIYAAGGARPTITYASGEIDAHRVADEIGESGGFASVMSYNVTEAPGPQLAKLGATPQQLYYFASERIARRKRELFDHSLLDTFLRSYVSGFYEVCHALRKNYCSCLYAFYPSTIYIEESPRGMTEYVMAKLAGEALCRDLMRYDRAINILVRRLPPLLTDQNAGAPNVGSSRQAIETLLAVMRDIARTGQEPQQST